MTGVTNDALTEKIIACCFQVHSQLGPGFKEEVYKKALIVALKNSDLVLNFETEKEFEVYFSDQQVGKFRCDFFIGGRVIVELKSVTGIMPVLFRQQVLSYLKASKMRIGLLVNFGNKSCEVKRIVL